MDFHIEYRRGGKQNSTGTSASRGDAILAALQAKVTPALIVEGHGTTFGRGEVVAVILGAGEIVTRGPQPAWWDRISKPTQSALLAGSPSAPMSSPTSPAQVGPCSPRPGKAGR